MDFEHPPQQPPKYDKTTFYPTIPHATFVMNLP